MIHHLSIAATNPQHVSEVLAELMGGKSFPFPGGVADSFIAVEGDQHGTAIEVYPDGMQLRPDGASAVRAQQTAPTEGYGPFHLLLSVSSDLAAIERIGQREGWLTRVCARGAPGQPPLFHVVEFWLENRLMVELAPLDMIGEYERVLRPERLEAVTAARQSAAGR